MMPSPDRRLADRVKEWSLDASDPIDYAAIDDYLYYMERKRYGEYEPTRGPSPDFRARLAACLDSAPDAQSEKTLFRLVPRLLFLGQHEFHALYRLAMTEAVAFWLLNLLGIGVSSDLGRILNQEVDSTWFCPITDSMQISAFYHVNNISGQSYRPSWHVLERFGNEDRVERYMSERGIERLVLLEDFVGTGNQMYTTVQFAAELPSEWPVLLVPLVTCPEGESRGEELAERYDHLSFAPVLRLPKRAFVSVDARAEEPALYEKVRELVQRVSPLMDFGTEAYYGPFGYGKTGGLVVMYTNCPNNTLPVVHRRSEHWSPMFPRSSRL